MRDGHGAPRGADLSTWLGPDPPLALVTADLDAYMAAHPCDCEAVCECDRDG